MRLLRDYDPDASPDAPGGLDVPDPFFGGTDGFEEVLEMIEAASGGLLDAVAEALDGASADPDEPVEERV